MSFSWQNKAQQLDAAAQAEERQRQARLAEVQQRKDEGIQRLERMRTNLIDPFIAACGGRKSRLLRWVDVPMRDNKPWRLEKCWHVPYPAIKGCSIYILPDGRWVYYASGGTIGSGPGEYYQSSVRITSFDEPGLSNRLTDELMHDIQMWMVAYLQRNNVPLPPD